MAKPVVYGPAYSTYRPHRPARAGGEGRRLRPGRGRSAAPAPSQTPEHLARHPFGKVPAFEHDGFALYETDAIARYVDETFPGTDLVPADARARARMTQAINVLGSYGYPCLITQIFMQRAVMPMIGNAAGRGGDRGRPAQGRDRARRARAADRRQPLSRRRPPEPRRSAADPDLRLRPRRRRRARSCSRPRPTCAAGGTRCAPGRASRRPGRRSADAQRRGRARPIVPRPAARARARAAGPVPRLPGRARLARARPAVPAGRTAAAADDPVAPASPSARPRSTACWPRA